MQRSLNQQPNRNTHSRANRPAACFPAATPAPSMEARGLLNAKKRPDLEGF